VLRQAYKLNSGVLVSFQRRLCSHTASSPPQTAHPLDPSIRGAFIVQTDPLEARTQIICEPMNGAEAVFPEAVTIFDQLITS